MRSAKTNFVSVRPASAAAAFEALEARTLFASTNDPMASSQWALANGSVSTAWDTTRGSAAVVVADTDTGADYTHADLYQNIWINQAEIPSSVKSKLVDTDSDGRITFYDLNSSADRPLMTDVNKNGYIDGGDLLAPVGRGGWADGVNGKSNANDTYTDDIIGWDFAENDNNPYDDGSANSGHGTHTAGILGAAGNNGVGISGVAQKVSDMIVRIFNDAGYALSDGAIGRAIRYAADNGAKAINASWGGTYGYNGDVLYSAIQYAGTKGALFVTAAGNDGWNIDSSRYNSYPAEYNLDNIVVVGATTSSNAAAYWSDYGAAQVDVFAPGNGILSTLPGGRYGTMSGTSMATPYVTGAIALMLSANRTLTASQIKARLIAGSDESTALNNRSVSDGKVNVANALSNRSGVKLATTTTASSSTSTSTPVSVIFFPWARNPVASGAPIGGVLA
jgi:subtilisin family serine protease